MNFNWQSFIVCWWSYLIIGSTGRPRVRATFIPKGWLLMKIIFLMSRFDNKI